MQRSLRASAFFSTTRSGGKMAYRKACTERYHATPFRQNQKRLEGIHVCSRKMLTTSCAAQESTPRVEGCARSPFSTNNRAAAIIIRCSRYSLRIFCREKAMADRSPCKDEISFLSVKVSSVLPQSASAVFFVMRYKYKKGGASCQERNAFLRGRVRFLNVINS